MGPRWPVLVIGLEPGPRRCSSLLASGLPFLLFGGPSPIGLGVGLPIPLVPTLLLSGGCAGSDAALDRRAGHWRAAARFRRGRRVGGGGVAARLWADIVFPAAGVAGMPGIVVGVGPGARGSAGLQHSPRRRQRHLLRRCIPPVGCFPIIFRPMTVVPLLLLPQSVFPVGCGMLLRSWLLWRRQGRRRP
jgi:hypothetical protein